jgi:repressor LexA
MTGSTISALTDIERQILDYMVVYLRTNTYQPSIREIGEEFGIKSTKTVSEHLQALAEKGFVQRDPSRSRGVHLVGVDLNAESVSVPCFEQVPVAAADRLTGNSEEALTLDRRLAKTKGTFMVRAKGDELAALGVEDGDLVLVEPARADEVPDGGTVALKNGQTVGFYRLVRTEGATEFYSSRVGRDAAPVADSDNIDIVGRVTALIRRLDGALPSVSVTAH